MVAEDVQRMGSNAARRNVDNARQQLAGDLIHIRDHQEQALRRRVGGRQRAGCERAVHGARRTGFGLHLRYADFTAEKILSAGSRILIGLISHDRRRRDRIDRSNVGKRIGNMRGSVVAIHGFHFSCHLINSSFKDYQLECARGKAGLLYPCRRLQRRTHRPSPCRSVKSYHFFARM